MFTYIYFAPGTNADLTVMLIKRIELSRIHQHIAQSLRFAHQPTLHIEQGGFSPRINMNGGSEVNAMRHG